jgi:hypothetical protein
MDRLLTETQVKERFAERDIRAKVGSDAETLEQARHILGNATSRITQKHYRRKPDEWPNAGLAPIPGRPDMLSYGFVPQPRSVHTSGDFSTT